MELCENGSARDLFARVGFRPVPETIISTIARGLVAAVQYLHDCCVLHRDIKAGACASLFSLPSHMLFGMRFNRS